jgi:hypothetical protein
MELNELLMIIKLFRNLGSFAGYFTAVRYDISDICVVFVKVPVVI